MASRLFIALSLPDVHRELLGRLREENWRDGWAWTPRAQLHLTLRFIGDVADDALVERLGNELGARVARLVQPFVLPVEGVGAFPVRGAPKTVWVGTGNGHPRLFQLRQRLDDLLLALGLDVDLRTFQPHITLARLREDAAPEGVKHFLKKHRGFEAPPFRVHGFGLYASERQATGAVHTLVQEFALGGA